MSIQHRFVEAFDTLSFRGNILFGAAGSYGEVSFPPHPSVLSGAFRSAILAQLEPSEFEGFIANRPLSDEALAKMLGTPKAPGDFQIAELYPARISKDQVVEYFIPIPADIVVSDGGKAIQRISPVELDSSIRSSHEPSLPLFPLLRQEKPQKSESNWLLNQEGVMAYLSGSDLNRSHLISIEDLWKGEARVGISISSRSRNVHEGALFTVEQIAPLSDFSASHRMSGLLVGFRGCGEALPASGLLRLGGDGRAARYSTVTPRRPIIDKEAISSKKRFKLVMQTPAIFSNGWLPDLLEKEQGCFWLNNENFKARLCCAAINRYEVVSGWDMARHRPKQAERTVPAGSVYWFDQVEGDPSALETLSENGFWLSGDNESTRARQAEGYNRLLIAKW